MPKEHTMKWWAALAVAILIVVLSLGAWSRFSSAVDVDVVSAEMGPIRAYVDERGKTRLAKTHLITMPYDARIEPIDLEEGSRVKQGEVVAQIVESDLQVALDRATAAVERINASMIENDDSRLETVSLQQALSFVISMSDAVKAAKARVRSGKEKHLYTIKSRQRVERLARTDAATVDDLDLARLAEVEADSDYQQDRLVHSAMEALQVAMDLMPSLIRKMIEKKSLSRTVLEKELDEAQAALQQAKLHVQRGTMRSPVDGVVLERRIVNRRTLPAGTVLLKIGRLEEMEVTAELLSQDVVGVEPGAEVDVYGPVIGTRPAQGRVHRVYPAGFTKVSSLGVEQQRVLVVVRFTEDELGRLRDDRNLGVGYRVRVRIVTGQKSQVLHAPRTALFRDAHGGWQVYLVRDGVANVRPVELGLMNERQVEVIDGLSAGDLVVKSPPAELTNGAWVRSRGSGVRIRAGG